MEFFKGIILATLFTLLICILLFVRFTIPTAIICAALVYAMVKLTKTRT